jgi:hypothetical protein
MPITKASGREAVAAYKANKFAKAPHRDERRLTPVANVEPTTSFKFKSSDRIFTVGSCFDRNVEFVLRNFGFDLPIDQVSEVYRQAKERSDPRGFLNKHNPVSILNEMQWAFAPGEIAPAAAAAFKTSAGYWDSQLHSGYSQPREGALEQRARITRYFEGLSRCDVMIVTLGLVEAWYDVETKLYLNETPPLRLIQQRELELHLLDYGEIHGALKRMVELALGANPALRIIMTVSPVTLQATFSEDDLVVRNCYSKSVLRAAAEAISKAFPAVDYFPSYETVIYSQRELAFQVDEVHVRQEIIGLIMTKLMRAYLDGDPLANEDFALQQLKAGLFVADAAYVHEVRKRYGDAWSRGAGPTATAGRKLLAVADRRGLVVEPQAEAATAAPLIVKPPLIPFPGVPKAQ